MAFHGDCFLLIECENAKCWLFAQNGTMPSELYDTREIHLYYKPEVVYLPYCQVQGNVECLWIRNGSDFSLLLSS